MVRIVVIGNAGGGKSTLARKLAERRGLRHVEIDRLLWQDGWVLTPTDVYMRQHREIIDGDEWLIDGLGQQASISERIRRAMEIILIDMPIWMHFWLVAERQIAWASGTLDHAPGGFAQMPPTKAPSSGRFGRSIRPGCRIFVPCAQKPRRRVRSSRASRAWMSSMRLQGGFSHAR
jgi:hypothetical protein